MMRAMVMAVAGFVAMGCGSPTTPSPATLVTITPGTSTLMIGATETFSAFAVRADGKGASVTATWTTDNPAVAPVSTQGLASALSAGVATITASYQGLSASRVLRVMPSYAGNWSGRYRTTACSSSDPSACMYAHAPGATTGVVAVFLTQLGDQVSGFVFLDDGLTIPVSGTITVSGELSLQGEIDRQGPPSPYVLVRIENWTSSINVVSRMLVGRFTQLRADGTSNLLSTRVESELLEVKPGTPP